MDPDPDPDPTTDPNPFFSDFKDAKKYIVSYFFFELTRRHTVSSLKNLIFSKILC